MFEVAKGSNTITTLVSFNGTNGATPNSLVRNSQGHVYGTTQRGGTYNDGTVFGSYAGIVFNGYDGADPNSLVLDGQGNLYGTTGWGGADNDGTVFEIAKGSFGFTTVASFNGTNGDFPFQNSLVVDGQGNLYGTASGGGAYNEGTVFEIAKGSNTITTLASFNGTNGDFPSSLVLDGQGNLYGTTGQGGYGTTNSNPDSGYGTVFEIAQGSNTITTLASFNETNGPGADSLVRDSRGNLYGTTVDGGADNEGIVFEIAQGSNTVTTLTSFNGTNGDLPAPSSLVLDGQGNLYGAASGGGAYNEGTVFELSGVAAQSSQTISFAPLAGRTYGVGPITLSAAATSGLPVGFSVISGPATLSGNGLTVTGAGTVVVQASQAGNATYAAATPVDESFAVSPAPLTITANNATNVYGAALPALSLSYSGFVNGDAASSLATLPTLGTPATASSSVLLSGYPIIASGASDPDYTISYVPGTLTVTPAPLTITANNVGKLYGAALPALTASYSGFVNGDTSVSLALFPRSSPPPPPRARSGPMRSLPAVRPPPTTPSAMCPAIWPSPRRR